MRSRKGSESGGGVAVGRGVVVARSASKVGFGVTVAMRLSTVGLGVIGLPVGTGVFVSGRTVAVGAEVVVGVMAAGAVGVAVGRASTTMSSGWIRGVAVGAEDWHANANAALAIADATSDLATTCIWICG